MSITRRTATSVDAGSSTPGTVTSITGTLPSGTTTGDFVVAVATFTAGSTPSIPTPSGWTQLFTPISATTGEWFCAYSAWSPGSAPTFTPDAAANRGTVQMQAYLGVDTGTPWDATTATTSSSGATTLVATGLTTVTDGALLVSGCGLQSASRDLNSPSGMTEDVTYGVSGGRAQTLAAEARATAGATGTRTWTWDGTSLAVAAFVGALRPSIKTFTGSVASTFSATGDLLVGMSGSRASTFAASGALSLGVTLGGTRASTFSAAGDLDVISRVFVGTLEIEFTAGVWTDVTSRLSFSRGPLTIRQGRATKYDDVTAGTLTCSLFNDDGALMPDNQGSAYYPNVVEGVRIRWRVTKSSTTYTRFLGWIQSWAPEFPTGSTIGSVVQITATDALGLLAQRILRSNFTETVLWRGRASAVAVDVYEATGKANGVTAYLTNFSNDTSPGSPWASYSSGSPTLSFADDQDLSCGPVVSSNPGTGGVSCTTGTWFQGSPLQIIAHFKTPPSLLDSSYWTVATFYDVTSTAVCNLVATLNGSNNGLFLMNAAETVNLGIVANLPLGQWVKLSLAQNAGTATYMDVACRRFDGTVGTLSGAAVDIRTLVRMEIPGGINKMCPGSWGGITALGTRTTINAESSWASGIGSATVDTRVVALSDVVDQLPVTFSAVGTLTTAVMTGRWSGRPASDVLQEITRTGNALAWARSRDSVIYAVGSDELYPVTPVATVDTDADCDGTPRLEVGTESRPTRIDVEWPGGVATVRDATAEAGGQVRSKRVTTVATTAAAAQAVGQAQLDRISAARLRVSQVTVDLVTGATDHTSALFSESTTLGGLWPTQRVRLVVPVSHFGVPTRDVHVAGWQESYSPSAVTVALDTVPAASATLASEAWTGANGSAWAGQWSATSGSGAAGATVDVQSNRGRVVSGAGGDVWKRLTLTATDVDITGLVQVTGTAEAQVLWRGTNTLGDAYALVLSVADGVRVQQIVGGSISTRYDAAAVGGPSIVAATDYRVRIRHQGTRLSIRAWAASGSEPGAWQLDVVDSLITTAGTVALRQWYASQTCYFDDLAIATGA